MGGLLLKGRLALWSGRFRSFLCCIRGMVLDGLRLTVRLIFSFCGVGVCLFGLLCFLRLLAGLVRFQGGFFFIMAQGVLCELPEAEVLFCFVPV